MKSRPFAEKDLPTAEPLCKNLSKNNVAFRSAKERPFAERKATNGGVIHQQVLSNGAAITPPSGGPTIAADSLLVSSPGCVDRQDAAQNRFFASTN